MAPKKNPPRPTQADLEPSGTSSVQQSGQQSSLAALFEPRYLHNLKIAEYEGIACYYLLDDQFTEHLREFKDKELQDTSKAAVFVSRLGKTDAAHIAEFKNVSTMAGNRTDHSRKKSTAQTPEHAQRSRLAARVGAALKARRESSPDDFENASDKEIRSHGIVIAALFAEAANEFANETGTFFCVRLGGKTHKPAPDDKPTSTAQGQSAIWKRGSRTVASITSESTTATAAVHPSAGKDTACTPKKGSGTVNSGPGATKARSGAVRASSGAGDPSSGGAQADSGGEKRCRASQKSPPVIPALSIEKTKLKRRRSIDHPLEEPVPKRSRKQPGGPGSLWDTIPSGIDSQSQNGLGAAHNALGGLVAPKAIAAAIDTTSAIEQKQKLATRDGSGVISAVKKAINGTAANDQPTDEESDDAHMDEAMALLDVAETEIKNLGIQITRLETNISNLQALLSVANNKVSASILTSDELGGKIQAAREELATLKKIETQLKANLQAQSTENAELRAKIAHLKAEPTPVAPPPPPPAKAQLQKNLVLTEMETALGLKVLSLQGIVDQQYVWATSISAEIVRFQAWTDEMTAATAAAEARAITAEARAITAEAAVAAAEGEVKDAQNRAAAARKSTAAAERLVIAADTKAATAEKKEAAAEAKAAAAKKELQALKATLNSLSK